MGPPPGPQHCTPLPQALRSNMREPHSHLHRSQSCPAPRQEWTQSWGSILLSHQDVVNHSPAAARRVQDAAHHAAFTEPWCSATSSGAGVQDLLSAPFLSALVSALVPHLCQPPPRASPLLTLMLQKIPREQVLELLGTSTGDLAASGWTPMVHPNR